jgi:hypothetical protein
MEMMMARTVKVRIPVALDPQGRWYAYGTQEGPRNHDELLEVTDIDSVGPNEALFWITAELPVPEVEEVAGDVVAADPA